MNIIRVIDEVFNIDLNEEYVSISIANFTYLNSTIYISQLENSLNRSRFCDYCRFRHHASSTCSFHEKKYFEYFGKYFVHNFVMNNNINDTNLAELLRSWLNRQKKYNLQLFSERCNFRAASVNKQRMIEQIIQYYTHYYQFTKNLFQEIINNTSIIVTQPNMMNMVTVMLTICNTTYSNNLDKLVDSIVLASYFNLYGDNINYQNLYTAMNRALLLYNNSAQPLAELSDFYADYFLDDYTNQEQEVNRDFEYYLNLYQTQQNANAINKHKKIEHCIMLVDNDPTNEQINCPVCYEEFETARVVTTNCNHDYCVECISKIIEHTDNPQCALCRQKINNIQTRCVEIHHEIQTKYEKISN